MHLSLRKKRIPFYYAYNARLNTTTFCMSSFRTLVFFYTSKWSEIRHDPKWVMGPNPRNTIRRVFELLSQGVPHCKTKMAQQRGQWKRHFSSVQTLSCNWCCFGDLQVYSEVFCSCRKDFKIKDCFQLYEVFDCEKRYSGNKYTQVPWLVPGTDRFLLLIHI